MPVSVPFTGGVTTVNVSESFSTSLPLSVTGAGVFVSVGMARLCAAGASFTGFTVMLNVPGVEVFAPSLAVHVKESVPVKLSAGV